LHEQSFAANAGTVTTLKIWTGSWFQMVIPHEYKKVFYSSWCASLFCFKIQSCCTYFASRKGANYCDERVCLLVR